MNNFYFIFVIVVIKNFANAEAEFKRRPSYPIDQELQKKALDSEQCKKQLDYIKSDTLLLIQFLESGLRVPRGITEGNLRDLGNYQQCLGIHQAVDEMQITGKYCLLKVPINQMLIYNRYANTTNTFDPSLLHLDKLTIEKLKERGRFMRDTNLAIDARLESESPVFTIEFLLALCLPKVCKTEEALNSLFFNIADLGFKYQEDICRIPEDKPWVTADYVAVVVFSILGFITLLSTGYDIYYTFIIQDPKDANNILKSFSAYNNCNKLLNFKPNPGTITCIDGIRTLAIFWVIVGHVFFAINATIPSNLIESLNWSQSFSSIWLMTATLSVDTFFILSGLLLVFTTAGKFTGMQLVKNIHVFYLNRLLRMFPVLAAMILFEASFLNRLGDGPLWSSMANTVDKCRNNWWATLLYVQNFVQPLETCIGVTWYLAIDIQLHILSPIILFWVLSGNKKFAWSALTFGVFASLTVSTAYIYGKQIIGGNLNYFIYYYVNILTRAPPFFIGMFYGYMLHIWRGKKGNLSPVTSMIISILSIGLLALVVYCQFIGGRVDFDNIVVREIFEASLRPAWGLSLGWLVFACYAGHAGPLNWFLSLSIWRLPARISYAMYLIHLSLMYSVYYGSVTQYRFTVGSAMFDFMAFLFITMVVSFFVTALIDSPFAILFKTLLDFVSKKPHRKPLLIEDTKSEAASSEDLKNPKSDGMVWNGMDVSEKHPNNISV